MYNKVLWFQSRSPESIPEHTRFMELQIIIPEINFQQDCDRKQNVTDLINSYETVLI